MIRRACRLAFGLLWLLVCGAVMVALQSCSRHAEGTFLGPGPETSHEVLTLPSPPGYPARLAVFQQLHAVHRAHEYHLEALLQLSDERISAVFTLPLGPRLATIDWSTEGVRVRRNPGIAEVFHVPPKSVLAVVVVAFWPEAAVAAHLRPGLSLVTGPGERRVLHGDIPVVEVKRKAGADPWNGRTVVVNRAGGYRITIDGRTVPAA